MNIVETDWGVANTYKEDSGYVVELNKNLKDFPELRERIIRHESEHTKQKSWFAQRKVDALTELKFKDLYPFYKKYPKTFFQQHSPITYKDKIIFFEWSLITLYTIYLGLGLLIYWTIRTFSKDITFFWIIIRYMAIISIIVIGLYIGGKKLRNYINEEAQKKK